MFFVCIFDYTEKYIYMKKIALLFVVLFTNFCQITFGQVNEQGYRSSEINLAKQQLGHRFINNSLPIDLDVYGSFIYSSFNKAAINGDFVNYNNNENYTKTISTQGLDDKIKLRFAYFSTEANADFLYIYDGPNTNSSLLAVLSGSLANNSTFQSSSNSITLKFVSNATNTDLGFKLFAFAQGPGITNQLAQKTASVCNSVPASNECLQAPAICDFNVYCGVTSGSYTAGNTTGLGNFCGSIENNSWISFIPSSSNVSFVVTSGNCLDNSSGIQVTIYDTPDCVNYTQVSNCESQGSASGTFTITNNVPLQIGQVYYMMIDGFAGNVCSYTISAGAGMIGSLGINTPYPEICAGYTTTLTSSVFSTNYTWTDNFGNTFPNQQSITVSPTVTTTYSLEVDPNSCGITNAIKTVTVNSTLSAPTISSSTLICNNSTVSLTTNAVGYNYVWTGPNGFYSTLQSPEIPNFTGANNGTYSLNINIDSGCAANEAIKTLTMAVSPTVGLVASSTSLCNFNGTSSVTFTASGVAVGNNYVWNWNPLQANVITQNCVVIPFIGVNCNNTPFSMPGMNASSGTTVTPNMPTTICVVATATNGCVSTSTCISITEASTATLQISGNTNICRGDSSLITATGSAPFAWTFPVNSGTLTLSSDGDSLWVKPNSSVTYTVKAADAASCTATRYVNVGVDTLCVWPGDTDRDGLVSQNDVLPIGVYYGASGAARPNASLNWDGQYCLPWLQTQTGGLNVKHVDSDGNGSINSADTLAIYQNINLMHALKTTQTNTINPEVSITFHKPIYNANDTVIAYLHLGVDTVPVANFYGAAFKFTYDDFMIQANTAKFNFINSWVGTPSIDVVTFNYFQTSSQQFLEGFVRNTHSNVSGYGKFAVAKFLLQSALTSTVFSVTFSDGVKTSNDYNKEPLASVTATVPINVNVVTGIVDISQQGLNISPNPTNGALKINSSFTLQKVEVINIAGQVLLSEKAIEKSHQLHLQNFAEGIYFIKVTYNNGMSVTKKVIKQ
jgi:hypothetical protein